MPSSRNVSRRVVGFVVGILVLVLAGALLWRSTTSRPSAVAKKGTGKLEPGAEQAIHYLNSVPDRLEVEKPIHGELKGGQGYRYFLDLEEGQFAHVVVEQRGVDVRVNAFQPGKDTPLPIDSPNGKEGPEIVFLRARETGRYRLELVCEDFAAPAGHYEIRLEELRPATPEDLEFYETWMKFRRGERQRQNKQPREAALLYEQALSGWRNRGHPGWEAEAHHRLGRVRQEMGLYRDSIEAFRAALPWFQEHGPRAQEGEILNFLGLQLFALGETEEALASSERARSLFHDLGKPALEAEALHNLGSIWLGRGNADQALALLTQARDLAYQGGDPLSLGLVLHGLGGANLFVGQFDAAQDCLVEALALEKKAGDFAGMAVTLRTLADVDLRRKDTAAARRRLDEALASVPTGQSLGIQAALLNSLGVLALEEGKPGEAKASFESALVLAQKAGDGYSEGFSLLNLGRALFDGKDVEGALRVHEQAAALFKRLDLRRGLVSTLYGSARALNTLGRFQEAEERLEQVGNDTELLRGGAESQSLRSYFFATRQHYFDLNVDVLMSLHERDPEKGYDHLALEVNEKRRARSLLEELGGQAKIRPAADPKLLERRREIDEAIDRTEEKLSLANRSADSQRQVEDLEQQLRSLLLKLDGVRTALRPKAGAPGGLSEPRPIGLKAMQELLDDRTLLLVFSLGETRSHLWCVANRGRIESRTLPGRTWVQDRVDLLSRIWSQKISGPGRAEQAERLGRELSGKLLGGVAGLLGTRRLVIVPDGALQRLSFAALPDPATKEENVEASPLLVRHEIAYLPSASVLAVSRRTFQRRSPAPLPLIVLADPVFARSDPRLEKQDSGTGESTSNVSTERDLREAGLESLPRLPYSEQEAEALRGIVGKSARVLSGFEANLATVEKGSLSPYRILHFATHGWMNPALPELSGLVLSRFEENGTPRLGFLRSERIADLDLRAELAVLSACETGVGTDLPGEGAQALTRSFFRAGVPRLVVSLWEVNDEGTSLLMERFYRGMIQHQLPYPQALRCAQLSLRDEKRWSDPYYWAPFAFQGEWEKKAAKPPSSDDSIERQSGGGMLLPVPDDGFPPPDDAPPFRCPDLKGSKSLVKKGAS